MNNDLLDRERKRADWYRDSLQRFLNDLYPLIFCMFALGCILGVGVSGYIFFILGVGK